MTRERDRIQENANKYIVKNCPCYANYENKLHLCCDGQGDGECQGCTDCVIKQVIEKCKDMASDRGYYAYDFANEILQLFDIEEINK